MAKIVHSDAAPSEKVRYSFAGVDFEIDGKSASFESNDPAVLSNAETHPWIKVERDAGEIVHGEYRGFLDPKDDALSAVNSVANDPEAARAALPSNEDEPQPAAIEAGRDQEKKAVVGGVSETLAADAAATDDGKDE